MKNTDYFLVMIAAGAAIFSPLILTMIIYPAFQVFLPEGRIILTPPLRITATIVMSIIDYAIAYIPIYHSALRRRVWFNVICYILTLLWCCFMGLLWYFAAIE